MEARQGHFKLTMVSTRNRWGSRPVKLVQTPLISRSINAYRLVLSLGSSQAQPRLLISRSETAAVNLPDVCCSHAGISLWRIAGDNSVARYNPRGSEIVPFPIPKRLVPPGGHDMKVSRDSCWMDLISPGGDS